MSAQSPELLAKIALWRAKCADGTMTVADYREAIKELRAGRVSAAVSSESARRTKAKAVIPTADEMLNELENL